MKLKWCIAVLFPLPLFAQKFAADRPDELAKPDPFTAAYFADMNDYRNVESLTTVVKERYRNFKPDTLSIFYYEKGLKVKAVNFNDNKRSNTHLYKYDANRNITQWQIIEKYTSTLARYRYDKKQLLQEIRQYTLTPKTGRTDTAEKSKTLYQYKGLQLVNITGNGLGMDVVEQYHYNGNVLHSKTGGFVSKLFARSNTGRVSETREFMGGTIDSTKLMGIEKFVYDRQGRVIIDSLLTGMNMATNTYQVTEYTYGANGLVDTMRCRFGNAYRNVVFGYVNGKIKDVAVETNSSSGYLRFLISHRIPEYYSFPLQYREAFGYDAKGNRVSKKVYVNDELFTEVEYLAVYRK